mmetsp:Transcript_14091/g.20820  ORF Transcript_14091/g.20820 Transcript_14091/m.20820 type:complete len:271 (-) Transcript_14091:376-1188(-)
MNVVPFHNTPASSQGSSSETNGTDKSNSTDASTQLSRLTIVSMNIAGSVPSKDPPSNWNQEIAGQAIRSADVLALQEFPAGVTLVEEIFSDYQAIGATHAHADQMVLLVRKGIAAKRFVLDGGDYSPAVVAELSWAERKQTILVGSVHLAPFREGSAERERQVDKILKQAGSLPLIFAGDTNMRVEEDERMEADKGLQDAWKLAGSDPNTKYTWDTVDHTAESTSTKSGSFNRYCGDTTRQYTARYDECTVPTRLPSTKYNHSSSLQTNR